MRGRPHIGVLVERLADREPQAPQRDVIGHVGRAGRAEQDGVVALDQVAAVLRHERAGLLVALGAPVERVEGECKAAVALRAGGQRLDPGGDHLGADAVAWYGCDAIGAHGKASGDCSTICTRAPFHAARADTGATTRAWDQLAPAEKPALRSVWEGAKHADKEKQ
jgi:hypothetical protein